MVRRFLVAWLRGLFLAEEVKERFVPWALIAGGAASLTDTTPVSVGETQASTLVLPAGVVGAVILFLLALVFTGVLAWVRTPRLDIVFDPEDPACMMVSQDSKGRTDRMYRVIVVNRSSNTVDGVSVLITKHYKQGSSLLPQRLRFKDERFQGQKSENYEQLSKIDPGRSAQRYVDVVSHADASDDYPIVVAFALTDIENVLSVQRYILTLVAKAHNSSEVVKHFEIDTGGQFSSLTFKPYYPPHMLRVFGREFSISKIARV